jgi:hypothetical protein
VKLYSPQIFKSALPIDCHFKDPQKIQSCLEKVCVAWVDYLQDYVDQTDKLFGMPELPWTGNERPMVSSLATAIARKFPNSLAVEECNIPIIKTPRGRCDLWVSIPYRLHSVERFNFYLEAKKSNKEVTPQTLSNFLTTRWGVSRGIRAYQKRQAKPRSKLSPFTKLPNREHAHFFVVMLVTRLKASRRDSSEIEKALHQAFENTQKIALRWKREALKRKSLVRFPTTAVVVLPDNAQSGMIASFTVFGSSREFLAR